MSKIRFLCLKMCVCCSVLERVADGEMDGVGFLEAGDVEVAGRAGVVGEVEGEAPIETDDEESEVVAQADTRAQGEVVEEFGGLEHHHVIEEIVIIILFLCRGTAFTGVVCVVIHAVL